MNGGADGLLDTFRSLRVRHDLDAAAVLAFLHNGDQLFCGELPARSAV
jgi:hypothetical protein